MALTKKEVEITRLIISPEKASYMDALDKDENFAKAEIAAFKTKRLSELQVDLQVNADKKAAVEAEIALLNG